MADTPHLNPHIRETIVVTGERSCRSLLDFWVGIQNLGRKAIITTPQSYGTLRADQIAGAFDEKAGRAAAVDFIAAFIAANPAAKQIAPRSRADVKRSALRSEWQVESRALH